MGKIDISVVIAVRNEEKNITELLDRLAATLKALKLEYELVFVTDENHDDTWNMLKKESQHDKSIKAIKLSKSFGQHMAMLAGIQHARGKQIVMMDGDLQDCPEDIAQLYRKAKEGYDVVYGIKEKKDDKAWKNALSSCFIKLLNFLSDVEVEHNTMMFRLISRRVADELKRYGESEPIVTALIDLMGFPTAGVPVASGVRLRGVTKYNFFRQLNIAINFLLAFSTKPLRLISGLGLLVSMLSLAYFIVIIVQKIFFHVGVAGWPTIVAAITFLGGIQLLGIGIIGEYIGKIYIEAKKRPLYVIEEISELE